MEYIRVNKDLDAYGKTGMYHFIKDEYLTIGEFLRICKQIKVNECKLYSYRDYFNICERNKTRMYWFFGCRFYANRED